MSDPKIILVPVFNFDINCFDYLEMDEEDYLEWDQQIKEEYEKHEANIRAAEGLEADNWIFADDPRELSISEEYLEAIDKEADDAHRRREEACKEERKLQKYDRK